MPKRETKSKSVLPVRIVVVDDNPSFRKSLAEHLTRQETLEVVGEAESASEARRMVKKVKPDLVLLDYSMPGENGVEACRTIKAMPDPPKVIMATMFDGKTFCKLAAEAAADDYITKIELYEVLLPTIRRLFPRIATNHDKNRSESDSS